MTRDDINYWLSRRFDPAPPTDEELTAGRRITKSQLARSLANDIKTMVQRGSSTESIAYKVDHLARLVKDDEPEPDDEEASEEDIEYWLKHGDPLRSSL